MARKLSTVVLIAAMVIGAVQPVMGWIGSGFSSKQSNGPCSYSLLLQSSVEERRDYLIKVAELAGGGGNTVGAMYGSITPASGSSDDDALQILGFGTKPASGRSSGVDPFSTGCLTCHDGATAVLVEANYRNDPYKGRRRGLTATDHPVGMDYGRYAAVNSRDYKPLSRLHPDMLFVDGKVGCLTCHNPLNPARNHLVFEDTRSALCLTCHNK